MMERRNYRDQSTKTIKKWHGISHDELNHLFQVWGIIGKRRQISPVVRLVPYFDRGPGIPVEKGHAIK